MIQMKLQKSSESIQIVILLTLFQQNQPAIKQSILEHSAQGKYIEEKYESFHTKVINSEKKTDL